MLEIGRYLKLMFFYGRVLKQVRH